MFAKGVGRGVILCTGCVISAEGFYCFVYRLYYIF